MRLKTLLKLEALKQRKRINFLILFAGAMSIIAWIWGITDKYVNDWGFIIYECFMENTSSMPVILAAFASRQMDFEHKGDTWKLLYTFATPSEIFFTKAVRATVQIFIAVLLQFAAVLLVCRYFGFTEKIPFIYAVWMILCTFLVSEILFLIHAILSFFFANQAVSICVGLAGFFVSLFMAFFEQGIFHRLLPWGLYGCTMPVRMDWQKKVRILRFYYIPLPYFDLCICIVWIIALLIFANMLLKWGNTDEKGFRLFSKNTAPALKENRFHVSFPTELLKMRQLPPWLSLLILPMVSAFIGTFNYLGNLEVLTDGWYSLWSQHTLFLNYLFMPVILSIFAASIWHVEHTGANWHMILTNASAKKIVIQKYVTMLFFDVLAILWTTALFLFCGKFFCDMPSAIPKELPEWILCGLLGAACISAFQILISVIIRNFAFSIGISFIGTILGLIATAHFKQPYILPYSLLSIGMRSNNPMYALNYKAFFISCTVQIIIWVSLCIFYINHTDVRTSEG